jgi:hypothetical protein
LKDYSVPKQEANDEEEEEEYGAGDIEMFDGVPIPEPNEGDDFPDTSTATSTCSQCTSKTATGIVADKTVTPTASATVSTTASAASSPAGSVSKANHGVSNSWCAAIFGLVAAMACTL